MVAAVADVVAADCSMEQQKNIDAVSRQRVVDCSVVIVVVAVDVVTMFALFEWLVKAELVTSAGAIGSGTAAGQLVLASPSQCPSLSLSWPTCHNRHHQPCAWIHHRLEREPRQ